METRCYSGRDNLKAKKKEIFCLFLFSFSFHLKLKQEAGDRQGTEEEGEKIKYGENKIQMFSLLSCLIVRDCSSSVRCT